MHPVHRALPMGSRRGGTTRPRRHGSPLLSWDGRNRSTGQCGPGCTVAQMVGTTSRRGGVVCGQVRRKPTPRAPWSQGPERSWAVARGASVPTQWRLSSRGGMVKTPRRYASLPPRNPLLHEPSHSERDRARETATRTPSDHGLTFSGRVVWAAREPCSNSNGGQRRPPFTSRTDPSGLPTSRGQVRLALAPPASTRRGSP